MEISALRRSSRSRTHSGPVLVLLVAACGIAHSSDANGVPPHAVSSGAVEDTAAEKLLSILAPAHKADGAIDNTFWHRSDLACGDHNTPPETLAVLAHDRDAGIRQCAILNKNTDIWTIDLLQTDTTTTPGTLHPYTTIGALARSVYLRRNKYANAGLYIHDPDPRVRFDLAYDGTDALLLFEMSKDSDVWIRETVAGNKHTPDYVLDILGNDTTAGVQSELPEFWQYWTVLEDSKGKFLIYASRQSKSKTEANGYKTHTIWLNFSKDPKAKAQEPKQYDLSCFDNRYSISGASKSTAAVPGSRWFKIIRAVCTHYTTTSASE